MDSNIFEIVNKRLAPGIAIFNMKGKLLYVNKEALEIIPVPDRIPEDIKNLCNSIKCSPGKSDKTQKNVSIYNYADKPHSIRAIPIGRHKDSSNPTHIMILIERITKKREIDIQKAKDKFKLTKRETEIVKLISDGHANKEISEMLFVSEYTVKDHIKNIMKKMDAKSRNEIAAILHE